jgi:hypothetical protein
MNLENFSSTVWAYFSAKKIEMSLYSPQYPFLLRVDMVVHLLGRHAYRFNSNIEAPVKTTLVMSY